MLGFHSLRKRGQIFEPQVQSRIRFMFFFSPFTSFLGLILVPGYYRCGDPNLVDVPVSIESVHRRCYHAAFFTNRMIEVGEELTWDYGTSLKHNGPSQSIFRCGCNSILCKCRSTKAQVVPSSALNRTKHHQSNPSNVPGILYSSLPKRGCIYASKFLITRSNRIPSL